MASQTAPLSEDRTAAQAVPAGSAARRRIVDTALALFYRDGIRATGIDRIIAEAGVTKATFYRHFPSKDDLVVAFLDARHAAWMDWFRAALQRHGGTILALPAAMAEWFTDPAFRGCAFLNSVGELGVAHPAVRHITLAHKLEVQQVLVTLLGGRATHRRQAEALLLALDGAILRAQYDDSPRAAVDGLRLAVKALVQ